MIQMKSAQYLHPFRLAGVVTFKSLPVTRLTATHLIYATACLAAEVPQTASATVSFEATPVNESSSATTDAGLLNRIEQLPGDQAESSNVPGPLPRNPITQSHY